MKNTTNLYYGSCKEEKLEIKIICNNFWNKIKINYSIYKSQNFLFYKNYYKLLLPSKILIFCHIITRTRLIYYNNLYSSFILLFLFVLVSITEILSILYLFIAFSVIIRVENLFFISIFMQKVSNRNITLFNSSRAKELIVNIYYQRWFRLIIKALLELFY